MTLALVLLQAAREEFDDAFDWYEQERPGLGVAFDARVRETFDRLTARPQLYQVVLANVRRAPVRQFPYLIFYRIEPRQLVVLSVFHSSRDPAIWQSRI